MQELIYQVIAQTIIFLFPAWRIFRKAGLNPTFSLTVLIPILGILLCASILAFSKWQVQLERGN